MKAIIEGKRYDTATAELIGEGGGGSSRGDFSWWAAGLYRTPRSGRYFLAGEGGPMTMFRRKAGEMWGYGRGVHPLTDAEALAWAEQHLDAETVEAAFADQIEEA